MNNKFKFKINIFGLGYVGLTLAAKLLEKGFLVNGFNIEKLRSSFAFKIPITSTASFLFALNAFDTVK